MYFVTNILPLVFGLSELILLLFKRSHNKNSTIQKDKMSMPILWIVIILSMTLAIICTNMFPRIGYFLFLRLTGLSIFMAGTIVRWISIYQLGKSFTVDVSIGNSHELKQDELYAIVRHPSYFGLLLQFIGISLVFNSWYPLFVLNLPVFLALSYRIKVEEELLLSHFGEVYRAYMKRVSRLVPFIY